MKDKLTIQGTVTTVHHEKNAVTISYTYNNTPKKIQCKIDESKRPHQYRVKDVVSFSVKGADRGTRLVAYNLSFLYNAAVEVLLQKAKQTNLFRGYIKMIDDTYFIKERSQYLFFPLTVSAWQIVPEDEELHDFYFEDVDKPQHAKAVLAKPVYTKAYISLQRAYNHNPSVKGVVVKKTPYAVYVTLPDHLDMELKLAKAGEASVGETINVTIKHIAPNKIVLWQE